MPTKQQIWQSNANKEMKKSTQILSAGVAPISKINNLIGVMSKLINEGTKYDDVASKGVLKLLIFYQQKLFKLGTQLGAKLADMRANSNLYVDHPVYGRLRY